MVFALLSAVALALFYLLTRKLSGKDTQRTTLFYSAVPGTILLSMIIPFHWEIPVKSIDWFLMFAMGILGLTGHFCLVKAFRYVSASALSPFLNAQLLAATIYSVFFFDDVLKLNFYLGTSLIVLAGLIVWHFDKKYIK